MYMVQLQYALGIKSIDFDSGIRLYDLYILLGGGVDYTTIQCVHGQSFTGVCIFPVFYLLPMDHLCTNR